MSLDANNKSVSLDRKMSKGSLAIFRWLCACSLLWTSIVEVQAQQFMGYSPRWYGPNANPIPEAREAMIPQGLRLHNSLLYQLSQKDKTATLFTDLEIPIISERASVRIYGYGAEYFQWSPESISRRGITSDHQKGLIVGDIYLQTRVRLLAENAGWRPNVVLNYTLKTASPKPIANESMRFFDTPGYFFHLEVGRNLLSPDASPVSLRLSGHIGFMCWETVQKQNDAFTYALALSSQLQNWHLAIQLGGYNVWMKHSYGSEYGDEPMHLSARCSYRINRHLAASCGLECGLRDYPFTQLSLGLTYTSDYRLFH